MRPTPQPPVGPEPASVTHFLRLPTVMQRTGLGRSTIYRLIAEEKFPSPVHLTKRAVAWRLSDLEQWSAARSRSSH